jgi:methyltransferase
VSGALAPESLRAAYVALVAAVAAERGFELWLSRRNAARVLARGGIEAGAGHYPVMALLHAAFLASCVLESVLLRRTILPWLALPLLAVLGASMALRYWAIATLGDRWNTRVLVEPGAPAVGGGPYRFLAHPNYLAVAVEIAVLPLIGGAWATAVVFSALDAALLRHRIRVEEAALSRHCDWQRVVRRSDAGPEEALR